jgi:HK97 family phage prohead protease
MRQERFYLRHADLRARRGKKPGLEGYAAVFNQPSEDLGGFHEVIKPGAFTDCLASKPDVRALLNHNADHVLGRTAAGTLRVTEDDKGLAYSVDLPDTQIGRDLLKSVERGDINQSSFGFVVRKQSYTEDTEAEDEGRWVRELLAVDVFDVSPVTFPAYPQTSVDARAWWPEGLPQSVRTIRRLALRQDDDNVNENGCACDCTDCQDDDCENCTNVACDDSACAENGCPNQDQEPEENALRHTRGAVSFKKTPASGAESWDADAATNRLAKRASSDGSGDKDTINWSKYGQGFGWVDPDANDTFGGYKLPHHDVADGRLVSVWPGVTAAMGALLGARGGTSIPAGDKRSVYNHLAKEYDVHGKEPPDFHSIRLAAPAELEALRLRCALALRA